MFFEWDDKIEQINIAKHGIDFSTAALVFNDPNRIEKYTTYIPSGKKDTLRLAWLTEPLFLSWLFTQNEIHLSALSQQDLLQNEKRRLIIVRKEIDISKRLHRNN